MDKKDRREWREWGRAVGLAWRIEMEREVDEFCDEHGVSDEKRKMFKCVAPITMVGFDGTVHKHGK